MKKILLTSDSHGHNKTFEKIMSKHKDCDMFIHLGDIVTDGLNVARKVGVNIECVRGNGDYMDFVPFYKEFTVEKKKIIAVHGHMQRVKMSLTMLGLLAQEKGADIVLYGHTHVPNFEFTSRYFVNPGAVMNGQYGILTIDRDKINCDLRKI